MNKRIEEITHWKPLSRASESLIKLPERINLLLWGSFLVATALNVFAFIGMTIVATRSPGRIHAIPDWHVNLNIVHGILLAAASLSQIGFREMRKWADDLLDLDGKTVVFRSRMDLTPANSTFSVTSGPIWFHDVNDGDSLMPNAQIKIAAPLRRGEPTEVFLRKDGSGDWQPFSLWRIELIEADWDREEKTMFRLIDNNGQPLVASIKETVGLIWRCADDEENYRNFTKAFALSLVRVANLERRNNRLEGENQALGAKFHGATGAIVGAISRLRDRKNFSRSRKEARILADAFVVALQAILPANDPVFSRIVPDEPVEKRQEQTNPTQA